VISAALKHGLQRKRIQAHLRWQLPLANTGMQMQAGMPPSRTTSVLSRRQGCVTDRKRSTGFRRGTLLCRYMYDFAQLLAAHLDRRSVERAHRLTSAEEVR